MFLASARMRPIDVHADGPSCALSRCALKAFSMWSLGPTVASYLDGVCASGLYEARLGREEYTGPAGDREVALVRVVHTLGDADRSHELGEDEVEVGVALAVQVRELVDRHAADRELDVLAVGRVEAAQVDLVRDGVALGARDVDPGGAQEHVAAALLGGGVQDLAVEHEVAGGPRRRRAPAAGGDVDDGLAGGRGGAWRGGWAGRRDRCRRRGAG